jgi:SAM-dependent methyltransferase
MTSISQTIPYYRDYDWSAGGAEWSHYWGSSEAMWQATVLPRLRRFLPVGTILEIGAGFGRVSSLLHEHATERLILTDYTRQCIEACKMRFINQPRISCLLTDGFSLQGVTDNSVDLVFSFYSLVDADMGVIESYIREIRRTLKTDGVAFIHHSNAGAYYDPDAVQSDNRMQLLAAYRDISMSAETMRGIASENDLLCLSQECVNWDVEEIYSDCFSLLVRPGSRWAVEADRIGYVNLCREMQIAKRLYVMPDAATANQGGMSQ